MGDGCTCGCCACCWGMGLCCHAPINPDVGAKTKIISDERVQYGPRSDGVVKLLEELVEYTRQHKDMGKKVATKQGIQPLKKTRDLLRCHAGPYVRRIMKSIRAHQQVGGAESEVPLKIEGSDWNVHDALAMLVAPAVVKDGVDEVMTDRARNCFCVVQPAGHGAGFEARSDEDASFFNNTMVGAYYARAYYGAKRVAVVDLGPHRGPGTEGIIRRDLARHHSDGFFYGATYIAPRESREKASEAPLWIRPLRYDCSSEAFREEWRVIVRALESYGPEIILCSVGSPDHHVGERASLTPDDWLWAVNKLAEVASEKCGSRLVCVLEEGKSNSRRIEYGKHVLHGLTGTKPKEPTPPPSSSSTSTPPPPPPKKDRTAWVDPEETYFNQEIRRVRADNERLRKQLDELKDTVSKHNKHEENIASRCVELEQLLADERESMRPMRETLEPHRKNAERMIHGEQDERARAEDLKENLGYTRRQVEQLRRLVAETEQQVLSLRRDRAQALREADDNDAREETRVKGVLAELKRQCAHAQVQLDEHRRAAEQMDAYFLAVEARLRQTRASLSQLDDELLVVYDEVDAKRDILEDNATIRRMREREVAITKNKHINVLESKLDTAADGLNNATVTTEQGIEVAHAHAQWESTNFGDGIASSPVRQSSRSPSRAAGTSFSASSELDDEPSRPVDSRYAFAPPRPLSALAPGLDDLSARIEAEVSRRTGAPAPTSPRGAANARRYQQDAGRRSVGGYSAADDRGRPESRLSAASAAREEQEMQRRLAARLGRPPQ